MIRLSQEEAARAGLIETKKSKYFSKKETIDGIEFDSIRESERYGELRRLERAGEITELELQPRFELQPAFRDVTGKWHREIIYIADFAYMQHGRKVVEDVKPATHYVGGKRKTFRTEKFLIKRKMLLWKYREMDFRET